MLSAMAAGHPSSDVKNPADLDRRIKALLDSIQELKESVARHVEQMAKIDSNFRTNFAQVDKQKVKDEALQRLRDNVPLLHVSLVDQVACLRCMRHICEDLNINQDVETSLEVYQCGGMADIAAAMDRFRDNDVIQSFACAVIGYLARVGKVSKNLVEAGVHKDVLRAMGEHTDCLAVQRHALTALALMVERDCNIAALVDANTSAQVKAAMRRYAADDALQEAGRTVLERLTTRTPLWCQLTVLVSSVLIILLALLIRQDNWSDYYTSSKGVVDEILGNVTHGLGMFIQAATQHARELGT